MYPGIDYDGNTDEPFIYDVHVYTHVHVDENSIFCNTSLAANIVPDRMETSACGFQIVNEKGHFGI